MKKKKIITMILITLMSIIFLNEKISAASITPDHSRLDLGWRDCSVNGTNCYNSSTGWNNIPGTINNINERVFNFHFQTYGNSNIVFNTDNTYTLKYTFKISYGGTSGLNYSTGYEYLKKNFKVDRVAGNTDASSTGQTDEVIRSYSYTLNKSSDGSAYILTITFTPSANLKFVSPYYRHKDWDPSHNEEVNNFGPYGFTATKVQITAVKMSYTTGTTGAINQQTEVLHQDNEEINQNLEDINDTLNQEHEYNTNPSQNTDDEEQQIDDYTDEEEDLINSLNLNIENSEITINPNASTFIWEIVNNLRSMSSKIVLLFTSVLSLGLMKMILGR